MAFSHLLILLAPLVGAQQGLGTEGIDMMLHTEEQATVFANGTLAKLGAFTNKLRSQVGTASWISGQAHDIQSHVAAIVNDARTASYSDIGAKLHALVALSVKETDLHLNDTEFGDLRAKRADLLAAYGADGTKLQGLNAAYKNQLMKTELCGNQKVQFAEAQELENSAQTAAADLAIIVATAARIPNLVLASEHQAIATRSAQLKQQIETEGSNARNLIQSLPGLVVGQIDGMSGGCEDKAEEEQKAEEKEEQEGKAKENEKSEEDKKEKGKKSKNHKKSKSSKHKKNKHHKETEEMVFLVDPSAFEIVEEDVSDTEGAHDNNIENLQKLKDGAADSAQSSVGAIANYLQAINKADFGATSAKDAAARIMKGVAAEFAQKRGAALSDLSEQVKALDQLAADGADGAKYKATLAAAGADMSSVKQIGEDEATGDAPNAAAEAAAEAETARLESIVSSVATSSQSMLHFAEAIQQLQEKENVTDTGYARADALSKRMAQVTQDAQEIANIIIEGFYAEVKKNVAGATVKNNVADEMIEVKKNVAHAQAPATVEASRETSRLFLDARTTGLLPSWALPHGPFMAFLGAIAMASAVVLTVHLRQRMPTINSAPLLG